MFITISPISPIRPIRRAARSARAVPLLYWFPWHPPSNVTEALEHCPQHFDLQRVRSAVLAFYQLIIANDERIHVRTARHLDSAPLDGEEMARRRRLGSQHTRFEAIELSLQLLRC